MEIKNKIEINYEQLNKIQDWGIKNKELVENNFYPFLMSGKIIINNMQFGETSKLTDYVDEEFLKSYGSAEELKKEFDNFKLNLNIEFYIKEADNKKGSYAIKLGVSDNHSSEENYNLSMVSYVFNDGKFYIQNYDMWVDKNVKKIDSNFATQINKQFPVVIFELFRDVNAYFFHYQQDLSTLEKKTVKRQAVQHKGKYHYNTTQYLDKTYTIKNKIRHNKISKTHEWHIDSWGVCGHLRHYASGKVVFIKPYTKGKNRANLQSKTYKIH